MYLSVIEGLNDELERLRGEMFDYENVLKEKEGVIKEKDRKIAYLEREIEDGKERMERCKGGLKSEWCFTVLNMQYMDIEGKGVEMDGEEMNKRVIIENNIDKNDWIGVNSLAVYNKIEDNMIQFKCKKVKVEDRRVEYDFFGDLLYDQEEGRFVLFSYNPYKTNIVGYVNNVYGLYWGREGNYYKVMKQMVTFKMVVEYNEMNEMVGTPKVRVVDIVGKICNRFECGDSYQGLYNIILSLMNSDECKNVYYSEDREDINNFFNGV